METSNTDDAYHDATNPDDVNYDEDEDAHFQGEHVLITLKIYIHHQETHDPLRGHRKLTIVTDNQILLTRQILMTHQILMKHQILMNHQE